ncbi:MAG: ABC transporter substrate-binding protein [Roseiflexaceae bacterium]
MKKQPLRNSLAICLRACALALVVALGAGCGAPGVGTPSASGQQVKLIYAFPNDATSSTAAAALIKAYTETRPDVAIAPLPLPAQDYAQQLLTRVDSDLPDMFVNVDAQAPTLIKRGAVLDIQPLLADALKLKADDFQPGALAPWQRGSSLYALPSDLTPVVMFYNRDLFAAGGFAEPTAGWTWDNWLADAQKLTVSSGGQTSRYGTAVGTWASMVWGNGGELVSPDGKRILLDSPEAAAGVQFAADLINVHHVAPLPQVAGGPDPVQLFKEQKVVMLPASSSLVGGLLDAKLPFKWGIVPLPAGKTPVSPLSVTGLAISAKSQNASAALDFAGWAIGPNGQALVAGFQPFAAPALRTIPARPLDIFGAPAIGQSLAFGRTQPSLEQWPQVVKVVNETLVPVWQGKATAAAAYAAMAPQANALLAG